MYLEGTVKYRLVYYLTSYLSRHRFPQTSRRMVRVGSGVVNCQLIVVGARARAAVVWCASQVQASDRQAAQHWAEHG